MLEHFATDNPGCTFILLFLSICFIYGVLQSPYYAYKRYLRHLDIKEHGWPTNPLMDADGDIIHPDKDD